MLYVKFLGNKRSKIVNMSKRYKRGLANPISREGTDNATANKTKDNESETKPQNTK